MTSGSLFLCHRLPYPPNKGDKIRSFAILKQLAKRGPVHLACFIDDPADFQYRDEVRRLAGGNCLFIPLVRSVKWLRAAGALLSGQSITTAYYRSPAVAKWVEDTYSSQTIDNAVIFGSAMAPYLLGDPRRGRRVLFDMVDVDLDKWRQYAQSSSGALRWIYRREAERVVKLEKCSARAFGKTLLVSEFEAETFRRIAPDCANKIEVMSNGVDLEYFSPGDFRTVFPPDELPIVMTGHMDYRPNVDGATWFATQVAPRVFAKLPRAHVYLVGSNPSSSLRRLSSAKITVTGTVDDVRPYIQGAAVIVAPLRIARGVQNKVLEAMAMKKPVVATLEATRALGVKAGVDLWVENEPQLFADAVVASIQGELRQQIVEHARAYVEQNHNWSQILKRFDLNLAQLAQKSVETAQGVVRSFDVPARSFGSEINGANA